MNFPVFNQQNYEEELGTGNGYSIAKFGCAITCVAALCRYYGKSTDPHQFNLQLINHNGFASNGAGANTLLIWGMVAAVYSDILLEKNLSYPTTPADMAIIDGYLSKRMPVIVGVSFTHNPKDTVPSHYVVLISKNADGTYNCFDPWFGDITIFDNRYAVNGMSPANAILQVVAYVGTPPAVETASSPSDAPIAASQQSAQTVEDQLRNDRDKNWNLYMGEVEIVKQKDARIQALEIQVTNLQNDNAQLQKEIADTKVLASTYASHNANLLAEDSTAITQLQNQLVSLQDKADAADTAASVLQTQPTKFNLLKAIDGKLTELSFFKRRVKELTPPVQSDNLQSAPIKSVYQLLGLKGVSK